MLKSNVLFSVLFLLFISFSSQAQLSMFDPKNTKEFVFIKQDSAGENTSFLCLKTNFTDSTLDSIKIAVKSEGYKETSKTIAEVEKINKEREEGNKYLTFSFHIMENGDDFEFQGGIFSNDFLSPQSYVGYGDKKKFNFSHNVKDYIKNHLDNFQK